MLQRKVLPRPTTTTQRERPDSLKCDEGAFWRAAGPRSLLGGGGESSGGGHQLRSGPQMAERWARGGSGENGGMEGVVGPLSSSDERKSVGVRGGGFQIGVGREEGRGRGGWWSEARGALAIL